MGHTPTVPTTTARGPLMLTPGAMATAGMVDTGMADMARGLLMRRTMQRAAPTPMLTSMAPTPMPDTAIATLMLPTLMALMELTHTPTVPTTTARGLLMPMPGAPGTVDTDTVTVTATAADTTDKPSAVLIALFSVLKMSSHHPHHTKYPSHSC